MMVWLQAPKKKSNFKKKIELNEDQKEDIKNAFQNFAQDRDSIDVKDLKIALRALGFEPKKEEIKRMITEVDIEKTGITHLSREPHRRLTSGAEVEQLCNSSMWASDLSLGSPAGMPLVNMSKATEDFVHQPSFYHSPNVTRVRVCCSPNQSVSAADTAWRLEGRISFNDFQTLLATKMAEKDTNNEIMKAFSLFDHGGKGAISFSDLQQVAQELGENLSDAELQVNLPSPHKLML
ncbi:CETN1 [Cordylochernes scorpioides]|uniref:CETN1 n=1 Tax=Cordylochernes scorpioides TaxID=51811 RepID=A0ABY6JWW6_9ARAC|nr:CETN1 [Cordylochernes scorpioides]